MPTGNRTEQYYDFLGQRVSTFSTMSRRDRLPLSHRITTSCLGRAEGPGAEDLRAIVSGALPIREGISALIYALLIFSRFLLQSCNGTERLP